MQLVEFRVKACTVSGASNGPRIRIYTAMMTKSIRLARVPIIAIATAVIMTIIINNTAHDDAYRDHHRGPETRLAQSALLRAWQLGEEGPGRYRVRAFGLKASKFGGFRV